MSDAQISCHMRRHESSRNAIQDVMDLSVTKECYVDGHDLCDVTRCSQAPRRPVNIYLPRFPDADVRQYPLVVSSHSPPVRFHVTFAFSLLLRPSPLLCLLESRQL